MDMSQLLGSMGGMGGGGGGGEVPAPPPVADPETAYASQIQQLVLSLLPLLCFAIPQLPMITKRERCALPTPTPSLGGQLWADADVAFSAKALSNYFS